MEDPTYRNMGDHTETVQVDYDPQRITYTQLLDIFWSNHRPGSRNWSRQYMNAIFYHNEQQHQQALASKRQVASKYGGTVRTEVLPLRTFTMAEDYHQKYILKGNAKLKNEMSRIFPLHKEFVSSTAVTRLNGYLGGNGSREQLSREIDLLGLSEGAKQALSRMIHD